MPSADIFGSAPNQIDANLKPTYADELIIGYEQEVFNRTSIEVSYIDKKTKDIFEDTCDGNVPTPNADATCDYYLMANLPDLKRDYEGVIVKFETRAKDWLNLLASYTYSKSQGNVEYTQNAGVDFDVYPVHFDNTYGYLSDDRRHRVKLNGYVLLPYNFTLGIDGFWSSAFAYSRTEAADPYGDTFLDPRGCLPRQRQLGPRHVGLLCAQARRHPHRADRHGLQRVRQRAGHRRLRERHRLRRPRLRRGRHVADPASLRARLPHRVLDLRTHRYNRPARLARAGFFFGLKG